VWDFLMTPERLRGCLPGCERFEATGPDSYSATLRLGVAFIKGTYTGTLQVIEPRHPNSFRLEVQGGGPFGALSASGTVRLIDATPTASAGSTAGLSTGGASNDGHAGGAAGASTYFLYDGQAQVTGRVAALGEGVIEATSNRLIGLFFDCITSKVEG
jgi:carbon monoxide dehydrogenase subunit G